jgi:outer membrane protein assembly factor BamC
MIQQPKLLHLTLLVVALLVVSGCDSIPFVDNTSDYKGASRGKPLEVPPDLTAATTNDTYSVPGSTSYSTYAQGEANQPQEEEKILPTLDSVKYEHAGAQRWLVVKAPPEKIWPIIRDFWTELGFAVRIEDPQTGVMETEWVDPADLTKDDKGNYLDKFQGWLDKLSTLSNRQKFRTRIDRGGEEATTEIYLSHRSISEVPDDGKNRVRTRLGEVEMGYKLENSGKSKNDEARSNAEDIDAELLRRLMVRLGIEEKKSRTLIASPSTEKRATLDKGADGSFNLVLNEPFDRAWRRVGLALDRIGFLVEDRDRSRGVFFVRYADIEEGDAPQDKEGLLDKLKFWGNGEKESSKPKPIPRRDDKSLVDKLKFWDAGDKDKMPEQQYSVKVEQTENSSLVIVTDKNGKRDNTPTANRILSMLFDQLK